MEDTCCDRERLLTVAEYLCSLGSRVTGSPAEADAATFIEKEFMNIGLSEIRHHKNPVEYYDAKRAAIEFLPDGNEVEGVPCWSSQDTPNEGIIAKGVYIGGAEQVGNCNPSEIAGKIVFVIMGNRLQEDSRRAWKELFAMNPAGVVFLDRERERAPRTFLFEPLHELFSSLPCMIVLADALPDSFQAMSEGEVRLRIEGSIRDGDMHIISGEKKGHRKEAVIVCAHHDSLYMTEGATDNAAGVSLLLELARVLSHVDTEYTYRFISFGGEEQDMKGSKWYVEHQNISDVALCFNIDSIGSLPGIVLLLTAADDSSIELFSQISENGLYPAQSIRASTSGGDNIIFASLGIPTIHLAVKGTTSGKVSHSPADTFSLLSGREMEEAGNLALGVFESIEEEHIELSEMSIPQDLVDAAKKRIDIS